MCVVDAMTEKWWRQNRFEVIRVLHNAMATTSVHRKHRIKRNWKRRNASKSLSINFMTFSLFLYGFSCERKRLLTAVVCEGWAGRWREMGGKSIGNNRVIWIVSALPRHNDACGIRTINLYRFTINLFGHFASIRFVIRLNQHFLKAITLLGRTRHPHRKRAWRWNFRAKPKRKA